MTDRRDRERRLRRAALTAATGQVPDEVEAGETAETDDQSDRSYRTGAQQTRWVDHQIRQAIARGDFDNLPGSGKPIRGLGATHDPDWWVKGLIERERLTGVAPPAIGLRKEAAELETRLDRETTEPAVRRVIEDFNARVVDARRQLQGGPPVITPTRDVDAEVAAWRERRAERRELQRQRSRQQPTPPSERPRRWWRRAGG